MKEKELWALNWLRFILSVYIVLFHTFNGQYAELTGTMFEALLTLGNMATTIFFVLSGFLLTHVYVVLKEGKKINSRSFLIARFASLYPLHIVGFLIALIPLALFVYARGGISVPAEPFGPPVRMLDKWETLMAAFTNFALLNAWNPYYMVLNVPSWSLSALAFYYLLFPFFAPRVYKLRSPIIALLVLAAFFALPGALTDLFHQMDLVTDGVLHRNPVIRLPLFLSGMVLCILFSRRSRDLSRLEIILCLSVIALTVVTAAYLQYHHSHLSIIKNGLYFPASLAVVWLCASAKPGVSNKVRYWGARLGAASLPMFFLHFPLYQLFSATDQFASGVMLTFGSGWQAAIRASQSLEPNILVYPVFLALLIIACVFIQERFASPAQARIKQYFSRHDQLKKRNVSADQEQFADQRS